jgi:hypothetical protein
MATRLQVSLALLLPILQIFLLLSSSSQASRSARRCRVVKTNETVAPLQSLKGAECSYCQDTAVVESVIPDRAIHVGVLLTYHQPTFQSALTIVAGLLTIGHRVTTIAGPNMASRTSNNIGEAVLEQIPCTRQAMARDLLTTLTYSVNHLPCDTAHSGDLISCHIQNAPPLVQALQLEMATIDTALDILLMDSTFVPGILLAHISLTPCVLLVTDEVSSNTRSFATTFLPLSGVPRVMENAWSLLSSRTARLAFSFVMLNRLRHQLGLTRIRLLSDLWKDCLMLSTGSGRFGGASFWKMNPLPNHLMYIPLPLIPPCLPCKIDAKSLAPGDYIRDENLLPSLVEKDSNADIPALIVAVETAKIKLTRVQSRNSIQEMLLECEHTNWELISGQDCAWKGPGNFYAVHPSSGDDWRQQVLQPFFVHRDDTSVLDSISRHRTVLGVVSICDHTNEWLRNLGPTVFCIDSAMSPRDIAMGVLQMLARAPSGRLMVLEPGMDQDGLRWILSLFERLGLVKSAHGANWESPTQMGNEILKLLNLYQVSTTKSSGIVVYLACTILVATIIYLFFKDTIAMQIYRVRRARCRGNSALSPSSIAEEFLSRLPEMDRVHATCSTWLFDTLLQPSEVRPARVKNGGGPELNALRQKRRSQKRCH